jgi:hypothetical protein
LLLRGADVNLLDHRGHSPLLATLFFADHAAVVALLLRGGAHVNLVDRVSCYVGEGGVVVVSDELTVAVCVAVWLCV